MATETNARTWRDLLFWDGTAGSPPVFVDAETDDGRELARELRDSGSTEGFAPIWAAPDLPEGDEDEAYEDRNAAWDEACRADLGPIDWTGLPGPECEECGETEADCRCEAES